MEINLIFIIATTVIFFLIRKLTGIKIGKIIVLIGLLPFCFSLFSLIDFYSATPSDLAYFTGFIESLIFYYVRNIFIAGAFETLLENLTGQNSSANVQSDPHIV